MKIKYLMAVSAVALMLASPAMADDAKPVTASTETQRDVNQQDRIEQGLKSGELNAREAARLEKGEARIDKAEANAEKDGTLTVKEKRRIARMQNKESVTIEKEKHDAQTGNADSASTKAMEKDIARDANQEKRIENGEKSGALSGSEAARLEKQQARTDKVEAKAEADGKVGAREERKITRMQNKDSKRIYHKKHNGTTGAT